MTFVTSTHHLSNPIPEHLQSCLRTALWAVAIPVFMTIFTQYQNRHITRGSSLSQNLHTPLVPDTLVRSWRELTVFSDPELHGCFIVTRSSFPVLGNVVVAFVYVPVGDAVTF